MVAFLALSQIDKKPVNKLNNRLHCNEFNLNSFFQL